MGIEEELNLTPPPLVTFSGEWDAYETELFRIFSEQLLGKSLAFRGVRVSLKKLPEYKKKHFAFWHLISEGEKEEERTPDIRRCERLPWVAWIITNCDNHAYISSWENRRGTQKHVVVLYEEGKENYVVILAKRSGYFLLKTAYIATPRRLRLLNEERQNWLKLRKKP